MHYFLRLQILTLMYHQLKKVLVPGSQSNPLKILPYRHAVGKIAYLDVVEGKQTDHGVVLALVPIFVDLSPHEYQVVPAEGQLARRLTHEVVQRSGHQTRLRRLFLGPASVTQIVDEVVVAVQRYWRFLRRTV